VHPGDDSDAGRVEVRLQHHLPDRRTPVSTGFQTTQRPAARRGQGPVDLLGLVGDLVERLGPVEVLATGEEPDLRFRCRWHGQFSYEACLTPPAAVVVADRGRRAHPGGVRQRCAARVPDRRPARMLSFTHSLSTAPDNIPVTTPKCPIPMAVGSCYIVDTGHRRQHPGTKTRQRA
jgi:hypothetical protein